MPEIFKAQIRAMLRASVDGKFKILLPMISDISEIDKAKRLIAQVMLELRRAKIPYDERIPVGVMIEVPSAALTAGQIARKVDFMSIGTNDLTQYTMAVDRNNMKVSSLYNTFHPSVLHLINMTVQACHKQGIPVTICGEVAGDPLALPLFIGLGVDQLSMNPARIVNLCRLIKRIDSSLVERLVESVLASASLGSVTRKLQSFNTAIEKK
jgi:phosphoenolpyruvate-protein kinase (PTS system EI component)